MKECCKEALSNEEEPKKKKSFVKLVAKIFKKEAAPPKPLSGKDLR